MTEEQEISQPYYRVVNGTMFGASAKDPTGPGTYWTPRWDAVSMMLGTLMKNYRPNHPLGNKWKTTVYQLDKAIMDDPPKEHKWAFQYHVDAGEQVLVKALEKPKIAKNPNTGEELKDLMPDDSIFMHAVISGMGNKPPIDWSENGVKAELNGKMVYIGWDYDTRQITVYEKDGWQFHPIAVANGYDEYRQLEKKLSSIDTEGHAYDGLTWFMVDMDREFRDNKPGFEKWAMPWQ